IGNAHLYEETKQRAEEMTALYHTSLEIGTPTDLPNLLWTICDRAARLLGVSKGGLYLYDEAREELELAVSYKLELDFAGIRIGLGEGVAGRVVQTGQSLTVDDYSRWEGRAVTYEEEPFAAVIGVPLRWQGRIIGAITLSEEMKRRTFTSADERLLGLFAQQAAAAIESARLYGEARRHVEELTALHTIDVAIASTLNLDEVLERIYEQIGALMDIDAFHIALYNEEEDTFHVPIIVDKGERLPPQTLEGGLSGWVVRTREPLWIEDMEKERDTMPVEAIALSVPARSLMVWPLVTRDKVIGVISAQSTEPHAFDEGHRRLFSGIASQVAIAVENARLFEETNRRLDELSLLHEAALATAATLDSDEILRRTVEAVNNRLNLDVFGFLLLDEDADLIRLHPTFLGVPDEMADFSTPLGEGIAGWVAQTGQPFLTPDVSKTSHYLDVIPGIRSEICVPLKVGDKVIGVINAESTQLNAFSEDDVRLFSTLASQLGVALDNARLFEETNRRLVEARLIQEVMLAAASTLDFDLVLERTVKALNRALGIKRLGFLLPDERNGVLSPHPSLVGFAGAAFQIPIKGSLAGHAYRTGQPMLVRDLARKPAYEGRAPDVRSVLAVPVRIANRIAAVLHAESNQVGAFGEDELLLFVTIAGQLGVTLNNAQLYQRLQEVNRSRTELVQNVGHELRTPLGLIKGYVELLRNGDLGPILDDQQSALQIVHERTIALTRLIRNLTVLQALPKEALTLAPLSLVALARRVLEEFRGSAARASVTFLEELPAELPDVMGDREQLKLAFGHLLDNAIKFSPDGGVVAIRAWAKRGMVCVSIADEGIGISSEHLEHIFERFYQVDGSASRRFGGMGVGLALVWEVIEAHGGTVDVDSEAGGGSTFTVALPQATDLESS
ncbi:MAG: GAF domain-containing protein, partial [Chloroflexota bacterium]|nr:GAF domain-containing protein [Chloroflexota bacterium]